MFPSVGGVKAAGTVNVFEGCTNKLDIKLQKSCSRSKEHGMQRREDVAGGSCGIKVLKGRGERIWESKGWLEQTKWLVGRCRDEEKAGGGA